MNYRNFFGMGNRSTKPAQLNNTSVGEKEFNSWREADRYAEKSNLDTGLIISSSRIKNQFIDWWTTLSRSVYGGEILSTYNDGEHDPTKYVLPINSNQLRTILENKLSNFIGQEYSIKTVSKQAFTGKVDEEKLNLGLWSNFIQQKVNSFFRSSQAKMFLRDGILYGAGFLLLSWDDQKFNLKENALFNGDVWVEEVDPYAIFPSVSSTNIQNNTYIFVVKRTTITALKQNKSIAENARFVELLNAMKGWDAILDSEILRDYLFINPAENLDWDGERIDFTIKYEKFYDKEAKKTKLLLVYYIGHYYLDEQVINMSYYPIVDLIPDKNNRYFWTMPQFRSYYDCQLLLARAYTMFAQQIELYQNPMTLIDAKSGINPGEFEKYRQLKESVLVINSSVPLDKAIYQAPIPEIPKELLTAVEVARNTLEYESGVNKVAMGDTVGSQTSARGTNQLIMQAEKININFQHTLNESVINLSKLLLEMYRCNIIGSKNVLIVDTNVNKPDQGLYAKLKTEFLKNYDLDCYIKASPKNENDKEKMFQSLIQIQSLQSNGQYQNYGPLVTPQELISAAPVGILRDSMEARIAEQNYDIQQYKATEIVDFVKGVIDQNANQQAGGQQIQPQQILDIVAGILNDSIPLPQAQQMVEQINSQSSMGQQGQGQAQGSAANQASNPANPQGNNGK